MPVTKHNWLVTDAHDIPRIVREAFHVATTGRPGPVLVDVPKDVANQMMDWDWPEAVDLPGYKPTTQGPRQADQGRGPPHGRGGAAGDLRGWRHPQGARGRGAARAGGAHRLPGRHHADGARCVPRRPRAVPRHARHARQLHRDHRDAAVRPAHRAGLALRRPRHRQARRLRARRQDHPRRHRPRRARQGPSSRRADRGRLPPRDRGAGEGGARREGQEGVAVARRLAPRSCASGRSSTRCTTSRSRTVR